MCSYKWCGKKWLIWRIWRIAVNQSRLALWWIHPSYNVNTMTSFHGSAICIVVSNTDLLLAISVRGPSYLVLTWSISWLLMPWLLVPPGLQQPWYWLCRIGKPLSYLMNDFNYMFHIKVDEWHREYKFMFMFPLNNLARIGLIGTLGSNFIDNGST